MFRVVKTFPGKVFIMMVVDVKLTDVRIINISIGILRCLLVYRNALI